MYFSFDRKLNTMKRVLRICILMNAHKIKCAAAVKMRLDGVKNFVVKGITPDF